MSSEKPDNADDILTFFSPRLQEILRRLAYWERRDERQELVWLIEARARGLLLYAEHPGVNPIIPLDDLPAPLIERISLQRTPSTAPAKAPTPPPAPRDGFPSAPPHKT